MPPLPPWKAPVGLDAVVGGWLASGRVRPCLTADREIAPAIEKPAGIPDSLCPELQSALRSRGIGHLYSHQAQALSAVREGKHVVVATPTASGKSLCFHLPVLDAMSREPDTSAIYLYPTKALARDQEASLRELIAEARMTTGAIVYDGDTPGDARRAARQKCPIILTNPDMLHAGILPHHAHWARTFQHLRYVVIDELHTYRGVFGSHVAHVIARLKRAAAFHGSSPIFICATATIGNAKEHAARLLGEEPERVAVVSESGAPTGGRRLFVFNPPVVNAELGVRASYVKQAVSLASDLVRARVPTIVFGQSRNAVEIMLKYLRDKLEGTPGIGSVSEAIMAYRGGYLPETRRRVERGLRAGEILCVVATNALELGIDIGDLDAVICAGYPGSIAETWQRFGRAGRRATRSIAVLVSSSSPVDQYLATHPEYLLDGAIEEARIDPLNTEILVQHLKCAGFELPFLKGEMYASVPSDETEAALRYLADHGVLHESGDRFHWSADAYPASHVSLRNIGWDNFVIIDRTHGRAIAELDWRAAPTMLHEQAIYQHDGEQFQVEQLDYDNHKAYVRKVDPDYFTTALTNQKVTVLDEAASSPLGRAMTSFCEVSVVEKVTGYKKIKFHTHENAGYGEVRLPDIQMHTTAFRLTLPGSICVELGFGRATAIDALVGVARALETVSTLALMCDPRDLGCTLGDDTHEDGHEAFDPTVFLFDHVPGGMGLAERIYEQSAALLRRTRVLIDDCPCTDGCPSCVGATVGPVVSTPRQLPMSRKAIARRLVDLIEADGTA